MGMGLEWVKLSFFVDLVEVLNGFSEELGPFVYLDSPYDHSTVT